MLLIAVLNVLATGPAYGLATTPRRQGFVATDGTSIIDGNGKVVVLRGVNFYGYEYGYWSIHAESDYARIASWGFNVVRLPIAWNFIEPRANSYDDTYLQSTVDRDLAWAEKYSIYVIIDMHQFRWSSHFTYAGSDAAGIPDWAVSGYKNSESGQDQSILDFWRGLGPNGTPVSESNPSMQDRFAAMWRHVAARYKSSQVVAGYDLLNEPSLPDSSTNPSPSTFASEVLPSFFGKVASAIRNVDPVHVLFWEPRGGMPQEPTTVSLNMPNTVYSVHYPGGGVYGSRGIGFLTSTIENLMTMCQSWQVPFFIGEWGIVADYYNLNQYIKDHLDIFDKYMIGAAWWTYGSSGFGMNLIDESGNPRQSIIQALVRPFVRGVSLLATVTSVLTQNTLQIQTTTQARQIVISTPTGYSAQSVLTATGQPIAFILENWSLILSLPGEVSQIIVQY
jgi:hypothetical protein